MVHPVVFAIATGIGLLSDKYALEATNYVEHYAIEFRPTDTQQEFIKSAMYAGAIIGMVTFGPASDIAGRRVCMIACSLLTFLGALFAALSWSSNVLIAARIITGIGMGGEYPLASSHSAESASDSNNGSRNVALLYLFGSGGGPALCALICYFLDLSGLPSELIWRTLLGVGSILAFIGLVLRYFTTVNADKFEKACCKLQKGARRNFVRTYWRPLLGTSLIWFLFDIVEYGLKQNDAAIFSADSEGPYRNSVLTVFFTRLLCIPSLALAPWLLTKLPSKHVQLIGFAGCFFINLVLAVAYGPLHTMRFLFDAIYIAQLSFQSLTGVTTMAIPAEIFPCALRGTGAAISAASGKVGATVGSYFFTKLKNQEMYDAIFWVVTVTCALALLMTLATTPLYNGTTVDKADELATEGELRKAVRVLYSGPRTLSGENGADDSADDSEDEDEDDSAEESN